jgi:hypothetical protein
MNVLIEKKALDNLIKKVDEMHQGWSAKKEQALPESEWVDSNTVLKLLGISKRTLQNFRDQGKIEFSKVSKKLIYYNRRSVEQLLKRNVFKAFNQK